MPYLPLLLPGQGTLVTVLRLLSPDCRIRGRCQLFRKRFGVCSMPAYLEVHELRYLLLLSGEYP